MKILQTIEIQVIFQIKFLRIAIELPFYASDGYLQILYRVSQKSHFFWIFPDFKHITAILSYNLVNNIRIYC